MLGMLMLIPLLGAVAIAMAAPRMSRWIALLASCAALVFNVILASTFHHWNDGQFGFDSSIAWLDVFGVNIHLGVDSVSMMLVLLTTILLPLCVWGSFTAISDRVREYYGWLMMTEAAMIGVFIARDLIFFYISFEFTLIPMFFLIAIWGGKERSWASLKFFLFTFTGSLLTLAGLLYVAWQHQLTSPDGRWSFEIQRLTEFAANGGLTTTQQVWVLFALLAGFAVKVPLFPLHTWLPLAHTEAPTAGSVILAGVLLKLGTYGLYRLTLPMVPDGLLAEISLAGIDIIPLRLIAVLSIIGILYAALVCWVQTDIKKLVAYSSVSHLGFCVLGLVALNPLGAQGSVLYMINHGLSTGALFFLVGMIYERYHTRDMDEMSGLARRMPVWAFFMVFFVLSSVGLPGLNGFVSECLCLVGAFTGSPDNGSYPGILGPWYAAVAGLGMIFAAMYLLYMVGKVVFGPFREPNSGAAGGGHRHRHDVLPPDLSWREIGVLTPLAIICLYIGLRPAPLTDAAQGSIAKILAAYPARIGAMLADNHAHSVAGGRPISLEAAGGNLDG
jgi:NADH-quinone oxidoreductase subunit M